MIELAKHDNKHHVTDSVNLPGNISSTGKLAN